MSKEREEKYYKQDYTGNKEQAPVEEEIKAEAVKVEEVKVDNIKSHKVDRQAFIERKMLSINNMKNKALAKKLAKNLLLKGEN